MTEIVEWRIKRDLKRHIQMLTGSPPHTWSVAAWSGYQIVRFGRLKKPATEQVVYVINICDQLQTKIHETSTVLLHRFVDLPGCHSWTEEIVYRNGSSRLFKSIMAIWKPCIYQRPAAKVCEEASDQITFHIQVSISHSYYSSSLDCTIF